MKSLLVSHVEPFSLGDESASVLLQSKSEELVVFSYPCDVKPGDEVPNQLSVIDGDAKAAYLDDWSNEIKKERAAERIERTGPFSYRGVGYVAEQSSGLIEVLGFVLDFGEVPCAGHVEFECLRVDL
ncbi:hypothetical protein [Vreelandella sp. GE22]